MSSLTAEQLADFRADIGDDGSVFTDAELNRLYTRAGEVYSGAVVLALRQLLANAAKLHDYSIVHNDMKQSQIFDHVAELLTLWEKEYAQATQSSNVQVKIVGLRGIPPRDKDRPRA